MSTNRREYDKEYYQLRRSKRPLYYIVKQARKRARQLGLEFDLKDSDLKIPTHCPVLGLELKSNSGSGAKDSYSIDRIDNTKGYTKDNVRVISFEANNLKGANTVETLDKIKRYITGMGQLTRTLGEDEIVEKAA